MSHNTSGVAREIFPKESGAYLVTSNRSVSHSLTVLGKLAIHVPSFQSESTGITYDAEDYSPRFRSLAEFEYRIVFCM